MSEVAASPAGERFEVRVWSPGGAAVNVYSADLTPATAPAGRDEDNAETGDYQPGNPAFPFPGACCHFSPQAEMARANCSRR
jgi:hypothetical protein